MESSMSDVLIADISKKKILENNLYSKNRYAVSPVIFSSFRLSSVLKTIVKDFWKKNFFLFLFFFFFFFLFFSYKIYSLDNNLTSKWDENNAKRNNVKEIFLIALSHLFIFIYIYIYIYWERERERDREREKEMNKDTEKEEKEKNA